MTIMYLLLPVALVLAAAAVLAFVWAARAGQFDDLETPGHRILHDDPWPPAAARDRTQPANGAARGEAARSR